MNKTKKRKGGQTSALRPSKPTHCMNNESFNGFDQLLQTPTQPPLFVLVFSIIQNICGAQFLFELYIYSSSVFHLSVTPCKSNQNHASPFVKCQKVSRTSCHHMAYIRRKLPLTFFYIFLYFIFRCIVILNNFSI